MTSTREATIRLLGAPGDLGWVVMAHGEIYDKEFGWDTSFEVLVARIVADYAEHHDPACEAAWIAEVDGRRAGCVFCVRKDETTAQLRILLVDPTARGLGLGARLVTSSARTGPSTYSHHHGVPDPRRWHPAAPMGIPDIGAICNISLMLTNPLWKPPGGNSAPARSRTR
jgi:GNAT superfamily N-acetyltransferase